MNILLICAIILGVSLGLYLLWKLFKKEKKVPVSLPSENIGHVSKVVSVKRLMDSGNIYAVDVDNKTIITREKYNVGGSIKY